MGNKPNSAWHSILALLSTHELTFEEARRRLLFGLFSVLTSLIILAFAIQDYLGGLLFEAVLSLAAVVMLWFSVCLARHHKHATSYYRIPAIVIGVLFIYFATLGDPNGYRMLWLYAYPPLVIFLLGVREGLVYVGLVTLAWVVALLLPTQVSGPGVYDPAMTLRFLMSYMLVVGVSVFSEAVHRFYARSEKVQNSELALESQQMFNLAYTDDLTQLPNRRSVLQMVDDVLAAQSFDASKTALLAILDIDRFKIINDHFGHSVGDEVLKSVSKRVANAVRSDDFFGRYGGEEFVLLVQGASQEQYQVIMEKVRLAVCKRPISLDGVLHHVSISVGGTDCKPMVGRDTLIEQADQALYVAKQTGRNKCVLFDSRLNPEDVTVTIAS